MTSTRDFFTDVDAVLIGAGAGLSAAAGIDYSGEAFRREFDEYINRYGFTDLYTSSFYPFETEEERWAYWAKHVMFARIMPPAMPLYLQLCSLVEKKPHFVITTNVDGQFRKAGFSADKLFEVQGDYAYIQAQSGRDQKRFYAEDLFRRMYQEQRDCRIPSSLVPYYRDGEISFESGEKMDINIRKDSGFVEDAEWQAQADRYYDFVEQWKSKRLLLLELGVGYNTPTIIRFPFERMAQQFPTATLVRINRDYPEKSLPGIKRFHSSMDMGLLAK